MAKIGVALFGLGRVGRIHLTNLVTNSDVIVRWMVDVEAAAETARDLCAVHGLNSTRFATADDCDEVYNDVNTQAVVICTPTSSHEELIKRAVRSGKDVLCEKPLAFQSDVVRSCYAEAEKHGRTLFCGFNRRFDPDHVRVRDKLRSGELGAPRVVHYNARDPQVSASYIKASGGIFCDACVHWLDYIPWLLGERPRCVVATGSRTSQAADAYELADDVDSTLITLQFPSGAHAVLEMTRELPLDLGWCTYVRMEVVGTKGSYFAHKTDKDTMTTVAMDGSGQETKTTPTFWSSYKYEMDCFVRVLKGTEINPVPASEAIQAHMLADMCRLSLKEGRVVRL